MGKKSDPDDNKKRKVPWNIIIPSLTTTFFSGGIILYLILLGPRISSVETKIEYLSTKEQLIEKTENLKAELTKELRAETGKINDNINILNTNMKVIETYLKTSINPKIERITREKSPPLELQDIFSQLENLNNRLNTIDTRYASIQKSLDETSLLVASSLPGNINTVEGTINSINLEAQTMELRDVKSMFAEEGWVVEKSLPLYYLSGESVTVTMGKPIVDVRNFEAVKPEQKAVVEYFEWKGKLYIKSIRILEEPTIKKKEERDKGF